MSKPNLVYSPTYSINVDLSDFHCTSAVNSEFGKVFHMHLTGKCPYLRKHVIREGRHTYLYLHRIVADASVNNPRPDLFDVVDHKDGNPQNNDPKNLRWVNCHLNLVNLSTQEGQTPPGVCVNKRKCASGKWYSCIMYTKNGCCLKSFRTLQKAVVFANNFNREYFVRLYNAYVNSPVDPYECRMYWAKLAISVSDYRCDNRKSRAEVLNGKFLVTDPLFKKLTMKIRNGKTNCTTGREYAACPERSVSN